MLGFDPASRAQAARTAFAASSPAIRPATGRADTLPYAAVYSGHQFGVWAGQLGDGRAIRLGEVEHDGERLELQLKGAGRTPYSRMGDGRAVLRSSIREFLCSEAMHHLGIPTTRALCVTGSDLPVRRETIETAAIVTRVAPSFVRFGHFEHFYSNDRVDELQTLADHVIDRFYPQCRDADDPYLALLAEVTCAHRRPDGALAGGRLLPRRDEHRQHVDPRPHDRLRPVRLHGRLRRAPHLQPLRYAGPLFVCRQPQVGYWNLFCLAQALVPLFGAHMPEEGRSERVIEDAQRVLEGYKDAFRARRSKRRCARSSASKTTREGDDKLANGCFEVMHANRADFTLTFRNSGEALEGRREPSDAPGARPVPRPRRLRRLGERLSRAAGARTARATQRAPRR